MWHQPCQRCKYTTLVDIQKRAIKKLFTHVESHASAVSLLESGELRYIKAINNNNTPSIAVRHLPPNSVRFGYATEGAFFVSAQLSTDAVSALRKVRVLIGL